MEPSSIICRKQEALHRERAAATTLENIRIIEERAATAWANEALVAERREARRTAAAAAPADQLEPAVPRTRKSWNSSAVNRNWPGPS